MSEKRGEFKSGGTRVGPEDVCGACWVRIGRRMWLANALVQANRIVGGSRSPYFTAPSSCPVNVSVMLVTGTEITGSVGDVPTNQI